MRYHGLSPLQPGEPVIEIETPEGLFDLHNFGHVEAIAVEPPDALTATVHCHAPFIRSSLDAEAIRMTLRFEEVSALALEQYEDNPPEASTWEHLIDFGEAASSPRLELRTGTLNITFDAAAVSARVEVVELVEPASFVELVETRFGPLMDRLGYRRTASARQAVRYERPPACVEVSHDAQRSYELDVWIGRSDREASPVALWEGLEAAGCPQATARPLALMQSADLGAIGRLLDRAAAALGGCGAAVLTDLDVIDRAVELREARAAADEAAYLYPHVLEDADAAWAEKDLGRVHALLHPVRDRLDATRRRRLDFAEKRLGGAT